MSVRTPNKYVRHDGLLQFFLVDFSSDSRYMCLQLSSSATRRHKVIQRLASSALPTFKTNLKCIESTGQVGTGANLYLPPPARPPFEICDVIEKTVLHLERTKSTARVRLWLHACACLI